MYKFLFSKKRGVNMSWKKKLATGITLIGASTFSIHLINKYIYFSATLNNLLSNPSGLYYEWKFGKIYYTKRGEGVPLLLIHDLTTHSSGYEWHKIVSELSKTNTVYCIDLLGCGQSDKPNLTYANYLYVQLISDFIKHVIGSKTNIIVTGESSSFVFAACHNDPSIIGKIISVNPLDIKLLSKIPTKRTKMISRFINLPIIGTLLYNILTKKDNIRKLFKTKYYYNKENIERNIIDTYYETAHIGNSSSKHLFASICGHYTTINIRHCLSSLTNSIYFIMGDDEPRKTEIEKKYTDILPSIETVTIEHTKHLPQLEKSNEFIEQVKVFLADEF